MKNKETVTGIKLNNQTWTLEFVNKRQIPSGMWGDANNETKTLRCRTDLSQFNVLCTALHEMLHAANFTCFSEEFVEETSYEMAKALIKSGRIIVITD